MADPREQPTESDGGGLGLKETAKVAAAAAAVGAAVGAARALTRQGEQEPEPPEDAETSPEAPVGEAEAPEQEQEPESEEPDVPARPPERAREPAAESQRVETRGVSISAARRVADSAREQLELLAGRPVESVSSLERRPDGWRVTLEVVELARIPESTDVLVSYEMTLDDDEQLVGYSRGQRYYRSQAGDGSAP